MLQALTLPAARDPLTALEQVDKAEGDPLFVLKDFHECWGNPQIKRKLRTVAQRLRFTRKSVLVTAPSGKLPEELKDEAVVVEFAPPSAAELEAVLNRLTQVPGVRVTLTKLGREKLVQAALGMTAAQAQRVAYGLCMGCASVVHAPKSRSGAPLRTLGNRIKQRPVAECSAAW